MKISIVPDIYSTKTATLFKLLLALVVMIIIFKFCYECDGIRSNTIRIFNSIISFILAILLPFTLTYLSTSKLQSEIVSFFIIVDMAFTNHNYNVLNSTQLWECHFCNIYTYEFWCGEHSAKPLLFDWSCFSFVESAQGLFQAVKKI